MFATSVPNGYATADYYWPFEVSVKSASPDVVHKQMAELKNGALVQNTPERGAVADSSKAGAWISLGDFKGKARKNIETHENCWFVFTKMLLFQPALHTYSFIVPLAWVFVVIICYLPL